MSKILKIAAVGLLASGLASGIALAQKSTSTSDIGDITVSATRAKATASTTGWPRAPVKEITLSYAVNSASYDLKTTAGAAELEKVINSTAADVCKEIGRQYPGVDADEAACTQKAASKAMVKVHELVAEANKKTGK
jgi:UrcA family protein